MFKATHTTEIPMRECTFKDFKRVGKGSQEFKWVLLQKESVTFCPDIDKLEQIKLRNRFETFQNKSFIEVMISTKYKDQVQNFSLEEFNSMIKNVMIV